MFLKLIKININKDVELNIFKLKKCYSKRGKKTRCKYLSYARLYQFYRLILFHLFKKKYVKINIINIIALQNCMTSFEKIISELKKNNAQISGGGGH